MSDKDKIINKNTTTNSYVNGRGEHLKFTNKSMSIYSNDPRNPHAATHINVNHEKSTFTVTTHNENKTDKNSSSGNCYLTTACINYFEQNFDDNCYELTVLRWFRDNFVSKDDIKHYYEVAPIIVETINKEEKSGIIYNYIYDNIVDYCVEQIEQGNYAKAYNRYKNSVLVLEEQFAKPILINKIAKTLKLQKRY